MAATAETSMRKHADKSESILVWLAACYIARTELYDDAGWQGRREQTMRGDQPCWASDRRNLQHR